MPAATVTDVTEALEGLGALSISLADPGGEPILEPGPGEMPLWPEVVLAALLPDETSEDLVRGRLAALAGDTPFRIGFTLLEDRDWVREFRDNLAPLRFGERLWVCPEGVPCPDANGVVITLEPGLAFGSGTHPTTALCLRWLASFDLGDLAVLDWGCGSGVLALAALALGARAATAVDIDPQALLATADNARRNATERALRIAAPAQMPPGERHDVIVANILADTLIALAPTLHAHAAAGARIGLSGILASQASRVCTACVPWFDLHPAAELDGWVLLTGAATGS